MTVGLSLVGTGTNPEGRPDTDFYSTPEWATKTLLDKEDFAEWILEPACGEGAMAKPLSERYKVFAFDKYTVLPGQDFLTYNRTDDDPLWDVVTNPPFKYAEDFLLHALDMTKPYSGKVALLLKLQFLEGQRRSKILKNSPLKVVYVFSKRLSFSRNNEKMANGGMMAFAWYVWDWNYLGLPTIDWV
jgi:hypothetical protein